MSVCVINFKMRFRPIPYSIWWKLSHSISNWCEMFKICSFLLPSLVEDILKYFHLKNWMPARKKKWKTGTKKNLIEASTAIENPKYSKIYSNNNKISNAFYWEVFECMASAWINWMGFLMKNSFNFSISFNLFNVHVKFFNGKLH